jgi:hypothetical protein
VEIVWLKEKYLKQKKLKAYAETAEFRNRKDLKKWVIVFVGSKATIEEV